MHGEGTGTAGMGPLTGRSTGFYAGVKIPGYTNSGFGRGLGLVGAGNAGGCFGLRVHCPDTDTLLTDGQIAGDKSKGTYSTERR